MIKLTFIGDIFPGDEFFTSGFGIKSKTVRGNIQHWKKEIKEVIGNANYIIGNLESPLIQDEDAISNFFYGSPTFVEVLKDSGINIINLANNHIAEHGTYGFTKTKEILYNKEIASIGGVKDGESEILTLEEDQTIICMAGFCDERVCSIQNPGCYASLDEDKVFKALKRMKAQKADVMIFVFHWGNEYIHFPSLEQRILAYKLIDNGANLIIGHHPHVIQPYEKYHGGHIIYSLGNFCFDDVQSPHFSKGMIAKIIMQKKAVQMISFEGVLLQDMAFGNNLVKKMQEKDFVQYFEIINNNYERLRLLSDYEYKKIYEKTCRQVHMKERILMRTNILKKITNIRHCHRKQLLNNIINFIIR